jgi:hypothetical protein
MEADPFGRIRWYLMKRVLFEECSTVNRPQHLHPHASDESASYLLTA